MLDDNGKARGKIGSLLKNFGALVVETPKNCGDDLGKVRLDANTLIKILVVGRPKE